MAVPKDWWQTFFSGFMVDFWLGATNDQLTREETDFVQKMLQVAPPARLLDVPCGGGRHALELTARGYHVTAVDISPEFLEKARAKAAERRLEVRWEQRDMRDLPWRGDFDGAYCLGNSFGYYEEEGNAEFLRAVAGALKPGVRFVLATGYVLESLLPTFQPRVWVPMGEGYFLWDRRYDPCRSRLEVEYRLIREGRVESRAMAARMYSCREVTRLMEDAGFTNVATYGSFAEDSFQLGSQWLLLVGTRKNI